MGFLIIKIFDFFVNWRKLRVLLKKWNWLDLINAKYLSFHQWKRFTQVSTNDSRLRKFPPMAAVYLSFDQWQLITWVFNNGSCLPEFPPMAAVYLSFHQWQWFTWVSTNDSWLPEFPPMTVHVFYRRLPGENVPSGDKFDSYWII